MLQYKIRYTTCANHSLWHYEKFKTKDEQERYIERLMSDNNFIEIVKIGFMNLFF